MNEANLLKKDINWDSELYYLISKNFSGIYSSKKILPLNDKIVNENNIEDGYIMIKTKRH
ncbi:hypothetical protein FACS1894172_12760 [Spirochaetia bacterium]|nr:hypothetical protein FACS1894172_12760 [Spirochaetia bacterium]